jgi:integrase
MPSNGQDKKPRKQKRGNGDGSLYQRRDGRWVGAYYAPTVSGARRRVVVYGKTREEARDKMNKAQQDARAGIPVPDEIWKLGPYLEYWLENFVKLNRRPATYTLYEMNIRLYLIPGLGTQKLSTLSVATVQRFLSHRLEKGDSVRKVQIMRTVLSAALTRAVREELISRNVARLVELPEWRPAKVRPWTADEARQFLAACKADPLHAAFALLLLYGLRRGEVLGLRWQDVDFESGTIRIEQQVQRVGGQMHIGPVKTQAGHRTLPLLKLAREALETQFTAQARYRAAMGSAWPQTDLVFTTRTGRPVEPRNLVRSFRRLCDDNGIRLIKVHHIRHTVASLLKVLGVPARDAQIILGHSRLAVTLEVYTHADDQAQLDALKRLEDLFDEDDDEAEG